MGPFDEPLSVLDENREQTRRTPGTNKATLEDQLRGWVGPRIAFPGPISEAPNGLKTKASTNK